MHGYLPLHHAVAPVGMAADKLSRGFFSRREGFVFVQHVIAFKYVEPSDAAHDALFYQLLRKIALLDEQRVLHQNFQIFGRSDHPAAGIGYAAAAHCALGGQCLFVSGGGCTSRFRCGNIGVFRR